MNILRSWRVLVGLVMGMGSLDAAWVVDSRKTELRISTQFGYLGSVNSGVDSLERISLTGDLQVQLRGSDSGSGSVGDTSWVAVYDYSLDQSIEYFSKGGFSASGSVSLFAFSGDQGIAILDAQPGNRLELGFRLTADESYQLSGIAPDLTTVTLERSLDNGQWAPIAEPGTGLFHYTLDLSEGQYRVSAIGNGYYDGSQGGGSSWSVQLVAIPEPVSHVAWGSVLLGGAAFWQSHRRSINAATSLVSQR